MCGKLVTFPVALGEIILPNHARSHICFKWIFRKMATAPQEMKVKTLQGDMIAVEVVPTNTVKELRAMLLESKECECPIERQLLRVEVLTAGLLVDDDQTVESAGLLCPESDVTVVYARREVEAATKESIHEGGPKGVIVPSHVTEIASAAFQYDEEILMVTIPESVTSIGANAFDGCGSLARIALPESLTIIEPCAFADCVSLESVIIPDSVIVVGAGAFVGCKALKHITLPRSLASISGNTFELCDSLTSIAVPDSVRVIEACAFFHCRSLKRVAMSYSVEQIGASAFENCESLANVHIPGSVTIIGKLAFAECRSLSEVSISGSVQTIGDYAFRDCDSLERLLVDEGVLVIGHGAFTGCRSLTNIWISESLRCNVEGAFERDVLQNITLFRDNIYGLMQRPFTIRRHAGRHGFTRWDGSPVTLLAAERLGRKCPGCCAWLKNVPTYRGGWYFCRFVYLFILICISVHIDLYTSFGGNSFFFCGAVAGWLRGSEVRETWGRDSFCDLPEKRFYFVFELDVLYTWTSLTYIYHHQSINITEKNKQTLGISLIDSTILMCLLLWYQVILGCPSKRRSSRYIVSPDKLHHTTLHLAGQKSRCRFLTSSWVKLTSYLIGNLIHSWVMWCVASE